MCICVLIGNLSIDLVSLFDFEALQQAHLLKSMGHSRQASDSSVDKFVSREEAAEPGDPESKVRHWGPRPRRDPRAECLSVLCLRAPGFSWLHLCSALSPSHVDLESALLSASRGVGASLRTARSSALLGVLPGHTCWYQVDCT